MHVGLSAISQISSKSSVSGKLHSEKRADLEHRRMSPYTTSTSKNCRYNNVCGTHLTQGKKTIARAACYSNELAKVEKG